MNKSDEVRFYSIAQAFAEDEDECSMAWPAFWFALAMTLFVVVGWAVIG